MALTVTFHAGGLHTAKGSALDRGPVFQSAVLTLTVQMRWGGPGACSRSEVVTLPPLSSHRHSFVCVPVRRPQDPPAGSWSDAGQRCFQPHGAAAVPRTTI